LAPARSTGRRLAGGTALAVKKQGYLVTLLQHAANVFHALAVVVEPAPRLANAALTKRSEVTATVRKVLDPSDQVIHSTCQASGVPIVNWKFD
jgi:hypothetical protein